MKVSIFKKFFAGVGILFFLVPIISAAVEFPKSTNYVNDFAGVLLPHEKSELDSMLKAFEDATTNQIFVAIVSSFQGLDRFTYSQELFNTWQIGQKGKNNGVLVLWGPNEDLPFPERGDIQVNVGPGLEGALPDSLTGSIRRDEMIPLFKEKRYFEGLKAGLVAIMQATKGEYQAKPGDRMEGSASWSLEGMANFFIFIFFIVINYLFSFLARSKSWWLGGVIGVACGVTLGFLFFEGLSILFSAFGFGGFGLILDYALSKNYQKRKAAGKPTDFWHSGGGFWFGGGRGGGGISFGGGGGGFSRGGGAGGSY